MSMKLILINRVSFYHQAITIVFLTSLHACMHGGHIMSATKMTNEVSTFDEKNQTSNLDILLS